MPFGLERAVSPQKALEHSMGAVLVGSLIALFLSGAVSMQVFLYCQLYPRDRWRIKLMVFCVWLLDSIHSAMAITANWQYLIVHFGDWDNMDEITWSVAASVALTALNTFVVHCFFTHRIHTLSRNNWYITTTLVALALVRLVSALISTSEMIRLHSYALFVAKFDYVFTIGLTTAASLDVLVATGLCYFLRRGRSGLTSMDKIVDTITLYTIENGMLTCITTIISLICWVTMPTNLIFLGLHFAISKLYANSLLATLNARKSLLNKSQGSSNERDHPLPVLFPDSFGRHTELQWSHHRSLGETPTRLEVNIQKSTRVEPVSPYGEPSSPLPLHSEGDCERGESVKSPGVTFLVDDEPRRCSG
ncbi:uncharacterized protein TRAVEDRAFT_41184 [Trametes versicolor FP-101664 SS1]|uniref:uncharacterized protein n=1 Tax=Trametes versicolor (strain FP-101664) TaxID=717944 RepID=UPI00046241A1|nr:uncharacterized protein TRAVEDRAFT_41184 [Trametes versicolor FP-101664 SS1]EIW63757.1 hypothetical protein TRAVEDRAFT_41184 [Trametes versicolor FP-101664 SS1]